MKWIWITLSALAAVVALVVIIGALQPVKHVATRRARFHKPIDQVWGALSPGTSQPRFRQDDVNYEVVAMTPKTQLITRIADRNLPYGGSWTYDLAPDGEGCALRITENGEVYNVFFRFVSRFVMGHTATIDASLKDLGKRLGEEVRIED